LCEEQIIRLLTTRTNFICQVCNTRLALSHKLAELILVEPLHAFVTKMTPHRHYVKGPFHAQRTCVSSIQEAL
jgi:hypothetical protein